MAPIPRRRDDRPAPARLRLQEARRRPLPLLLASLALAVVLLGATSLSLTAFAPGLNGAAPLQNSVVRPVAGRAVLRQPRSTVARRVLGIPKVAYRIPGAPNAEWVDIYNRLYRERIVFLGKEIDDRLANEIIGVLLYLDSEDNNKPIYLYINSVGGSVMAGLAIYDTLQHIKSPVVTINVGMAASMASFLLASGEPGKRLGLPHSRVMIHQAMGGAQGQAEDIRIEAQQILRIQDTIVQNYARMTGKTQEVVSKDLQRDKFMSAEEAKEYGIIDQVIQLRDADLTKREAPAEAPTAGEAPGGSEEAPPSPPPEVASPGEDEKEMDPEAA